MGIPNADEPTAEQAQDHAKHLLPSDRQCDTAPTHPKAAGLSLTRYPLKLPCFLFFLLATAYLNLI